MCLTVCLMMEFMFCGPLALLDCDYEGCSMYENHLKSPERCTIDLSCLLSPPWSPCDSYQQHDNTDFPCQYCDVEQQTMCCLCSMDMEPTCTVDPVIRDCMWSAGVAPPATTAWQNQPPLQKLSFATDTVIPDFETVSSFIQEEADESSSAVDVDVAACCARKDQPGTGTSSLPYPTRVKKISCCNLLLEDSNSVPRHGSNSVAPFVYYTG